MSQIALLKLGLSWTKIEEMPEGEALALLTAYDEIVNPDKRRKSIVKRPKRPKP